MGSIPVAGAIKIEPTLAVGSIFISSARRTHSTNEVQWSRVRNIAPSLPRRKPCGTEQIPVASSLVADLLFISLTLQSLSKGAAQ